MFKEQRCQTRYARIENASYLISPRMRKSLQTALNWLGSAEHKDITWINTDKSEILFAYPSQLPETKISFTRMFKRPEKRDKAFEEQAKQFLSELRQSHKVGTDSHADFSCLFFEKSTKPEPRLSTPVRQIHLSWSAAVRNGRSAVLRIFPRFHLVSQLCPFLWTRRTF